MVEHAYFWPQKTGRQVSILITKVFVFPKTNWKKERKKESLLEQDTKAEMFPGPVNLLSV